MTSILEFVGVIAAAFLIVRLIRLLRTRRIAASFHTTTGIKCLPGKIAARDGSFQIGLFSIGNFIHISVPCKSRMPIRIAPRCASFKRLREFFIRIGVTRPFLTGDSDFDQDFEIECDKPEPYRAVFKDRQVIENIRYLLSLGDKRRPWCTRLSARDYRLALELPTSARKDLNDFASRTIETLTRLAALI